MIWFRSFTFQLSYLFCSPCTTGEPSREVRKETDILGCWTLGGGKRASAFYSCNDLSQSKPISVCIFVEDDWEICTGERSLVCNHKNRWVRYRVEKKLLSGTSPFCPRVLSLQKKKKNTGYWQQILGGFFRWHSRNWTLTPSLLKAYEDLCRRKGGRPKKTSHRWWASLCQGLYSYPYQLSLLDGQCPDSYCFSSHHTQVTWVSSGFPFVNGHMPVRFWKCGVLNLLIHRVTWQREKGHHALLGGDGTTFKRTGRPEVFLLHWHFYWCGFDHCSPLTWVGHQPF